MERVITKGNKLHIDKFGNSPMKVIVLTTADGTDNVRCEIENGILYVFNNNDLVACASNFCLKFADMTTNKNK